jgi:hypothetical protein
MLGRGSFCKHGSDRNKPARKWPYFQVVRHAHFIAETKEPYFIKLHFVELLIHCSARSLCWYSLNTWKKFILTRKLTPCLLHNYCYSSDSFSINWVLRQYSFFGGGGYCGCFKGVFARSMGQVDDFAQRWPLFTPVHITNKYNQTLIQTKLTKHITYPLFNYVVSWVDSLTLEQGMGLPWNPKILWKMFHSLKIFNLLKPSGNFTYHQV